jgi:hypothetical protein
VLHDLAVLPRGAQNLHPADDGRQGRAQLVRERGEEDVLGAVDGLGLGPRRDGLFEQPRPLLLRQLLGREMLSHLVLSAARAQGRADGAQDGDDPRRALDERHVQRVAERLERAGVAGGALGPARQDDQREVGPRGLSAEGVEQASRVVGREGLLRDEGRAGALQELRAQLPHPGADLDGEARAEQVAARQVGVPPRRREEQDAPVDILRVSVRHRPHRAVQRSGRRRR